MPQVGRRHARFTYRARYAPYYGLAPSTAGVVDEASSSRISHSTSRFRHRSATGPLHVTTAPTRQPRFHRLDVYGGIGVPPRPERLGGEYGTLTGTETDARTRPTRAKGGLGRGLHPERWGRVAFVWPEKPFRPVSDVHPVTYFPTRSRLRGGREGGYKRV